MKVQLSETAAWERIGMPGIRIDLMDEPKEEEKKKTTAVAGDVTDLERDIANLKIDEDAKALDAERVGNAGTKKMDLTIREKDVKNPANPPQAGKSGDGHLGVEGHKSGFGAATTHVLPRKVLPKEDESSDDEEEGDDGDIIYGGVKMSAVTISQEDGGGMMITSGTKPGNDGKPDSNQSYKPESRHRIDDEDEIWRQLDAIRAQQSEQQ